MSRCHIEKVSAARDAPSSGPAILGYPLIWRQWPVGYDVLTNVAIMMMHLVGLAPASVEQFPRSHHGCFGVSALHPFHERLDGFLGVRACESFQLGIFLRPTTTAELPSFSSRV